MKENIINKKKNLFSKKFTIFLVIIFFLMSISAFICAQKIEEDYEENEISDFTTNRWDSDANLVDDRLPENFPIAFVISPVVIEGVQSANSMVIYNDGSYMSEVFTYESYDSFQEQLNSTNAFCEQLKQAYSDFKESDWAHISSTDLTPEIVREAYLEQYKINDFTINTQVDMTFSDKNQFFIFTVTYNDEKEATTHMLYGQTQNYQSMISSETGQEVLMKFTEILMQDENDSIDDTY